MEFSTRYDSALLGFYPLKVCRAYPLISRSRVVMSPSISPTEEEARVRGEEIEKKGKKKRGKKKSNHTLSFIGGI